MQRNRDRAVSDQVSLRAMRVSTLVGVHAWERLAPRDLLVDLDLTLDLDRACRTDDLGQTIDYDALVTLIRRRLQTTARRLIEAVAQDVADVCFDDARVSAVTVTVHKPAAVHDVGDVAVTIRRTRAR
ncbi:MAG: dihydroneopterin aldolase [Planctomycetes bacterium]|nr:dihydroneopterin aldolase [Planctomycetota bacterium]